MKNRELLKPGYRAFNGYVFTQADCDRYNSLQSRINSFADAGLPASEIDLIDSHKLFCLIIGVY